MTSLSETPEGDVRPGEEAPVRPATIAFSGVVDDRVVRDLQRLFHSKIRMLAVVFFVVFVVDMLLGAWLLRSAAADTAQYGKAVEQFAYAGIFFVLWFSVRKGWAHRLIGQEISGEIHAVGVVVDQLDQRATWDSYGSAWISDSSALLFQGEKEVVPRELALNGLALHRSFFDSDESWQRVRQLIRERIPKIRMVAR